jgi:tRNA/tmRNA/rRNA uracil-C5-methylase (TrmA/RlmC/RlmD family)
LPRKQSRSKREYSKKESVKGRLPAKSVRGARDKESSSGKPTAVTFAGLLRSLINKPARPQAPITLQSSPLAHLDYQEELKIKNQALALFWKHFRLPEKPEPIIGSPKPRSYRTTSKRKTIFKGNTLYLLFNDRALRSQKKPFVESPLEPREHGRIFEFLQQKISEPAFKLVAGHLNYLIIRGSYTERAVIFNVDTLNGPLVRKLKLLAGHLQKLPETVSSAYIYPDPSCSEYYLEEGQPSDILQFKKLFGKTDLNVSHHGCRYSYHPTSFSQVNEAMVPAMLDMAQTLLEPDPTGTLLDLYCGYGLFSHFLAPGYKQVVGIDAEGPSIRAAISNKKSNPASKKARFLSRRITARSVEKIPLPDDLGAETILLDPPRQGPQEGVIAALSRREPRKVLHIHCGLDQIPDSLRKWQQNGYKVQHIVPLDMFPGTAGLEVLILLSRP